MKRMITVALMLAFAMPTFASTHKDDYKVSCNELWRALKDTLRNSGKYGIISIDAQPVFYMYFPSTSELGGLGGAGLISSPSQFSLLSLEVKKNHRETAIAKISGFGGISLGNDAKKTILVNIERVRPYVYKVSPASALNPGEYAFVASSNESGGATGGTVVLYDFGIDGK